MQSEGNHLVLDVEKENFANFANSLANVFQIFHAVTLPNPIHKRIKDPCIVLGLRSDEFHELEASAGFF